MLSYCDFCEQATVASAGGSLRPDLIVKLQGGRTIVVDSKAPLEAYLAAHDETQDDEARTKKLKEHAGHPRGHINSLSGKSYWQQFQPAPEFVLLFLPGEAFYRSALEHDPSPTIMIGRRWASVPVSAASSRESALGNVNEEDVRISFSRRPWLTRNTASAQVATAIPAVQTAGKRSRNSSPSNLLFRNHRRMGKWERRQSLPLRLDRKGGSAGSGARARATLSRLASSSSYIRKRCWGDVASMTQKVWQSRFIIPPVRTTR